MKKLLFAVALTACLAGDGSAQHATQYATPVEGWRPSATYNDSLDLFVHGQVVGSLHREGYWIEPGQRTSTDIYALFPDGPGKSKRTPGVTNYGNDWQGAANANGGFVGPIEERVTINGQKGSLDEAMAKLTPAPAPSPAPPGPGPQPPDIGPNWGSLAVIGSLGVASLAGIGYLRRRRK